MRAQHFLVRDHPSITSAKRPGGWVQKIAIIADVPGWLGGLEKVQKCADVKYINGPYVYVGTLGADDIYKQYRERP